MSTSEVSAAWNAYRAAHHDFVESRKKLFKVRGLLLSHGEAEDVLWEALNSRDWLIVVELIRTLGTFLPRLFELASVGHGSIANVREVIAFAPPDYLRDHMRELIEPLLAKGGEEEFRRMYELLSHLKLKPPEWFLEQIRSHSDSDVRELELEFRS
jgi:hypothetical protein